MLKKLMKRGAVLALLFFFTSCSSRHYWHYREVVTDNPCTSSALLTSCLKNHFSGSEVQFLYEYGGVHCYLNVYGREIPPFEHGDFSLLCLSTGDEQIQTLCYRMRGGQRLLLGEQVSRYLIDALGTQIWEISDEQRELQVFEGSYTAYREHKEQVAEKAALLSSSHRKTSKARSSTRSREKKRRQARLIEIEGQIITLEDQLSALSLKLETPPPDLAKVKQLGQQFVQVQSDLEALMAEWEMLTE